MFPVNFEYPIDIAKAYEEKGRWIVEGYAATSDFDLQSDIITEEAIRASAKDLIESSTVLHNHNPDEAVGRVLESKAKKTGLFLKILISKTVPDIWQKVKEGVLNKFSVRGKIIAARKEWLAKLKRFVRKILRMRLVEVSLVAVPANPKARAVRWYVEKALDEFEKAGGRLTNEEGGTDMDGEEDVVVEEEILEGSGEPPEPQAGGDPPENYEDGDGDEAKGFPSPEELEKGWKEYAAEHGLAEKSEDEVDTAWVEFCKAQGYPYPYPYPYPKPAPERGTRMRQIVALVDKLLPGEKDEERKKLLSQIREIARGASYAQPPAKKEEPAEPEGADADPPQEPSGDAGPDVEKAGRKVSKARLQRLKKLLEELKTFIDEVDVASHEAGRKDAGEAEADEKLSSVESALADVTKRLEGLENAPGMKTSLDGQEPLPGENKDGKALWKGLV